MFPDGDESLGAHVFGESDVLGGEVARIRGGLFRHGVAVLDDTSKHRREVLAVGRLVANCSSDDDLSGVVDRGLSVEGLHDRTVAHHDPALGIGEVALRVGLGLTVGSHRWRVAREVVVVIIVVAERVLVRLGG